jgi:GT2 family glycosyltransferase
MNFGIVIPNKYQDVIGPLVESIKKYETPTRIIIIADGHSNSYSFDIIPYTEEHFVYSKAVNLGIKALGNDDVILLNDDCRIIEPNTFQRLDKIGRSRPEIGLISPLIKGGVGNEFQRWYGRNMYWKPSEPLKYIHGIKPVCFPCVWISRQLINTIGLLNENIVGYGGDDNEYCIRTRKTRFRTAITSSIVIQHGDGSDGSIRGRSWSVSFARRHPVVKKEKSR